MALKALCKHNQVNKLFLETSSARRSLTDFMNLKIRPSFLKVFIGVVCMRIFIGVSAHMCISIYVCIV
jgi:hypothetical protein